MNFFSNFFSFLQKNKKNIFYISLFVGIFFLLNDLSFAAWDDAKSTLEATTIQVTTQIVKWVSVLLGFVTFLVGLFLYPEWTSGSIVWLGGSEGALKQMWILISNVVYFVFALIFIGIAFMNVIGKVESFQIKQALPRFILGVLVVPFTWFFVQFILSLSSLLTIGVLSLPYDTFKDTYFSEKNTNSLKVCTSYVINNWDLKSNEFPIDCQKWSEKTLSEMWKVQDSQTLFGITTIYTYGVMWFDEVEKLYKWDIMNGITSIFSLWLKTIFDLVFIIVYTLLMIALAVALLVRGVALWFYAMFSPAFWLLLFFKKWEVDAGSKFKFGIKEFISLAFVPVYVSAALAFGLLFIFSAAHSLTSNKSSTGTQVISEDGKTITFGWFVYTFKGASPVGWTAKEWLNKLIGGLQGTVGTLMLQVLGLAILYMALMAALKQSSITASVLDPFEKIWGLIAKSPLYMPIPGARWQSLASLNSAVGTFTSSISWLQSTKWGEFANKMSEKFGITQNHTVKKLQDLTNKGYGDQTSVNSWVREALASLKDADLANSDIRNRLWELFQSKFWANEDFKKAIVAADSVDKLARAIAHHSAKGGYDNKLNHNVFDQADFRDVDQVRGMIWAWNWSTTAPAQTPPPADIPTNQKQDIIFNVPPTTAGGATTSVTLNVSVDELQQDAAALSAFEWVSWLKWSMTKDQFGEQLKKISWLSIERIATILNHLESNNFFTSRTS